MNVSPDKPQPAFHPAFPAIGVMNLILPAIWFIFEIQN
jgi:hypothetical protein